MNVLGSFSVPDLLSPGSSGTVGVFHCDSIKETLELAIARNFNQCSKRAGPKFVRAGPARPVSNTDFNWAVICLGNEGYNLRVGLGLIIIRYHGGRDYRKDTSAAGWTGTTTCVSDWAEI